MTSFLALLLVPGWAIGLTQPPFSSFYNVTLAMAGWGAVLGLGAWRMGRDDGAVPHAAWGWALAALVLGGWAAVQGSRAGAGLAAALAVAAFGRWLGGPVWRGPAARTVLGALAWGLLLAALLNVGVALVQYFAPAWADGVWVARPTTPGRAFGNLRQPNHLASLMLMGLCVLPVLATGRRGRWAWAALAALTLGVALSSSRTGLLGLGGLALWAAIDRGLPAGARRLFWAAPAVAVAWWLGLWAWGEVGGTAYYGETRLEGGGDLSSSRFAIWSNTLALIAAHPWTGVGWGNFNAAWTFTPFPDRPVAFFDHSHNLVLQLMVELGIPAALALLGALAWVLWRARGALSLPGEAGLAARSALMMLAVLGWHSLLEYPLWYAYFLLPAAFALGLLLGLGAPPRPSASAPAPAWTRWLFPVAGGLMVAGSLHAMVDYQRVVQIFTPSGEAGRASLSERIRIGQGSHWFAVHADYAAVTTAPRPSEVFEQFERPLRHLIDARLMIAYAKALHERGEDDRALYVVHRLREFRHRLGRDFLAVCAQPDPPQFPCGPQPQGLSWRELATP
ncbi:MAG: Wzy polymerase domain-containing protein [Caldimonas sp.]|uniref:PglL family O-oligosaccharyltransferase n=1 Tax=Caldimonas sp. TaxID=2838790 RepID=UPI00391AC636